MREVSLHNTKIAIEELIYRPIVNIEITKSKTLTPRRNRPVVILDEEGENGPCLTWRLDGVLHRTYGPAVVDYNKNCVLYFWDGKLHRNDGPAVDYFYSDKLWYKHGKLHRENGPAVMHDDGTNHWFIEGKELTEQEFNDWFAKKNRRSKTRKSVTDESPAFCER